MIIIKSISLLFAEGSSDKQYDVQIIQENDTYSVNACYGRRGGCLKTAPQGDGLNLDDAEKLFSKIVNGKTRKGYKPNDLTETAVLNSVIARDDTGLRPQLLNPITDPAAYLNDDRYVCQQKFDGERLLVKLRNNDIVPANRKGIRTTIPAALHDALAAINLAHTPLIFDGELIEGTYHIFDLLEVASANLRSLIYAERLNRLERLNDHGSLSGPLQIVRTFYGPNKAIELDALRAAGAEGVVFKLRDAPFQVGRPAAGGPQVKLKFWASASAIVAAHNDRNSIALAMISDGQRIDVGNVTVKANQIMPPIGSIVEVKYLYMTAPAGEGKLYQPELLGARRDIDPDECLTDQLQYKNVATA